MPQNVISQDSVPASNPNTDQLKVNVSIGILCKTFSENNPLTGNLGSIVNIFLRKTADMTENIDQQKSSMHIWTTFNALFVIRTFLKYLIETSDEIYLLNQFNAVPKEELIDVAVHNEEHTNENEYLLIEKISSCKLAEFFKALVNIIVNIPVTNASYHLHLEAVNMVIILLSTYISSRAATDQSFIQKIIYECKEAHLLAGSLLYSVARLQQVPQLIYGTSTSGSFVLDIAESLFSIFTFRKPHDMQDMVFTVEQTDHFRQHYTLANQSLLLLLILVNHDTTKNNLYRNSVTRCCNAAFSSANSATFAIDFNDLYDALTRTATIDHVTLLLYLMLHQNVKFYKFVVSQSNVESLIIPILQILYNAPESTSHHVYMSLIVLLILSEDDEYNKRVHQIILKNVTWYTERTISEISLGGLLVLVIIRTIQYNMIKMRDKYLHTNCLAALANMSGQFRYLHSYVSQRLVNLFESLAKKHIRLSEHLGKQGEQSESMNITGTSEDMLHDLNVLEEVLRTVLEILNSCLSKQLVYCPNLVYTLLYKREIFEGYRNHHAFQDIIQNIDMVVGYFSSRLKRVQDQKGELDVNEVLQVIIKGGSQWSNDRLRKFPELKFKYVEEDSSEDFFIPYVWTLVCKYGSLHINTENVKDTSISLMKLERFP